MPKIKTHHWAGVTLSLKNMFGIVPGTKYGWPKNLLHWSGIHESILDICATVPIHFVIADGITAMEGNPSPKERGKLVPSRKNTLDSPSLPPASAVPSLTPEGMRKTGSAEKDCDSRRTSPPGRR